MHSHRGCDTETAQTDDDHDDLVEFESLEFPLAHLRQVSPNSFQFADMSCAPGSAANGFGEGFKLARDIGAGGLVRDFGRTLRFERGDAVAPSCAIKRESQLRQKIPGDEAAIALVDHNEMLIVQREMAHALGYCVIGCDPRFDVGNSARLAPLEGGVEGDRRAVARSRDGARRTGIFALIEYRTQRQTTHVLNPAIGTIAAKTPSPNSCATAIPFGPAAAITNGTSIGRGEP